MEEVNKYIDFNCNLTNSPINENDNRDIIDFVSSVNISCELVNGSALAIKNTVEKCKFKNKVIGASLTLPEGLENPFELSDDEIEAIVLYQLGALSGFTKANNLNLEYARPDGLMYRLAAENADFSTRIAKSIKKFSKWLLYYGATGETLEVAGDSANITIVRELNLNSKYNSDGSINFDEDKLADYGQLLIRLRRLMNLGEIEISEQNYVKFNFDTIHFAPDTENIINLLDDTKSIVTARPYNYNIAANTGWVGINRNHYAQEINFEKNNK